MQNAFEPRVPTSRLDRFIVSSAGDDTLVYDMDTQALHTLNAVVNDVWQLCDGQQTVNSIVVATGYSAEIVKRALSQLEDAKLLETPLDSSFRSTDSRRSFMKKAGIAAAIPAIISVTAPMAAGAATGCTTIPTYVRECSQVPCQDGATNCIVQCAGLVCYADTHTRVGGVFCTFFDGTRVSCAFDCKPINPCP